MQTRRFYVVGGAMLGLGYQVFDDCRPVSHWMFSRQDLGRVALRSAQTLQKPLRA